MDTNEVQFKRVPLDTLSSHPSNYNIHPPNQLADLKASLMRYKQVRPIVVQQAAGEENHYIILAGHGITEAARELFAKDPIRYAHLNNWSIAIAPPSWSVLDAKGYMTSDNETSRKAEVNEGLLAQILQEQKEAGFDLSSLGSDDNALQDLLAKLTPPSLDDLEKVYGDEPSEDAFWPTIRVKVSPQTKELYDELIEEAEGKNEGEKFASLLNQIAMDMEVEAL